MVAVQEKMLIALEAIMSDKGISQAELAEQLGISQATICRALSRDYKRKSRARTLLENYIAQNELKLNNKQVPEEITAAVSMVWDGSQSHASAIARIIRSLGGLIPKQNQLSDGSENRRD